MASLPNRLPGLNFDLGENADMLRASVEAFAAHEIAPRAAASVSTKHSSVAKRGEIIPAPLHWALSRMRPAERSMRMRDWSRWT